MDLKDKKCVPCEGGTPTLTRVQEMDYLKEVPQWKLKLDGIHKITRTFTFKDFAHAMKFVHQVADLAEKQGHHPDVAISYNKVNVTFYTHAIKGLSENDFVMAAKIDNLPEIPNF